MFLGDSFTWGQGLHYYSQLPYVKLEDRFDKENYTSAHIKYLSTHRFAHYVANHFDTFYVSRNQNGGNNDHIIRDFYEILQKEKYYYEDFSYVIYQFTSPFRENYVFFLDGNRYSVSINDPQALTPEFKKHITQSFNGDFDLCLDTFLNNFTKEYEKRLKEIENSGIKVLILSWPEHLSSYILKNAFFNERLIKFNHNGKEYIDLETLMQNERLSINLDEWFDKKEKKRPNDGHLSLEGHKIVAENIIKKIEQYEQPAVHTIQRRTNKRYDIFGGIRR